jgi:hypothetical protein
LHTYQRLNHPLHPYQTFQPLSSYPRILQYYSNEQHCELADITNALPGLISKNKKITRYLNHQVENIIKQQGKNSSKRQNE